MSQQIGTRFCRFELNGDGGYMCSRDEYCCQIGCCLSPTFQFYQLWYYWFMVFFIFLVCSGGQWWYKYMMQGRCSSAMPPPPRRSSYPRQCRVAYTPARDTVVLHHLWKPSYTGMSGAPPAYTPNGPPGSSYGGAIPKQSPYMQLYGPPPSYESVVGSGPVPVHHIAGSPYDPSISGLGLPLDCPSNDIQPSFTGSQQQHFKPNRAAHFSEGPYSLPGNSTAHVSVERSGQDLSHSLTGSQQQHFKASKPQQLSENNYSLAGTSGSQIPSQELQYTLTGSQLQHVKQVKIPNLPGSPYGLASSGPDHVSQGPSQDQHYPLGGPQQQHIKPGRSQHHRHLSLGPHLEAGNSGLCVANIEGPSQVQSRPMTSAGHQHHKSGHHRPLSVGATVGSLEVSSYPAMGGSNPDVQLPLSLASTSGHIKSGHHHRQGNSGHTLPGSSHHHARQSSAHAHHYHPHHIHHRQASHPVPFDANTTQVVNLEVMSPGQKEELKLIPPPQLQDDRIDAAESTGILSKSIGSLPPASSSSAATAKSSHPHGDTSNSSTDRLELPKQPLPPSTERS